MNRGPIIVVEQATEKIAAAFPEGSGNAVLSIIQRQSTRNYRTAVTRVQGALLARPEIQFGNPEWRYHRRYLGRPPWSPENTPKVWSRLRPRADDGWGVPPEENPPLPVRIVSRGDTVSVGTFWAAHKIVYDNGAVKRRKEVTRSYLFQRAIDIVMVYMETWMRGRYDIQYIDFLGVYAKRDWAEEVDRMVEQSLMDTRVSFRGRMLIQGESDMRHGDARHFLEQVLEPARIAYVLRETEALKEAEALGEAEALAVVEAMKYAPVYPREVVATDWLSMDRRMRDFTSRNDMWVIRVDPMGHFSVRQEDLSSIMWASSRGLARRNVRVSERNWGWSNYPMQRVWNTASNLRHNLTPHSITGGSRWCNRDWWMSGQAESSLRALGPSSKWDLTPIRNALDGVAQEGDDRIYQGSLASRQVRYFGGMGHGSAG